MNKKQKNKKQQTVLVMWFILPVVAGILVSPLPLSIGNLINRSAGFYAIASIPALILLFLLKSNKKQINE